MNKCINVPVEVLKPSQHYDPRSIVIFLPSKRECSYSPSFYFYSLKNVF